MLAADAGDVEESGIGEITTPAFAVREHGQIVAAAGYRDWPLSTAHLSVLTASAARGRGLARAAASAAVVTRSRQASCHSGGHARWHRAVSRSRWDSANSAPR